MGSDCVVCNKPTPGGRDENCLKCSECETFTHFTCITAKLKIAEMVLSGDMFYKFTCKSCSHTSTELVVKEKVSWLTALIIALYNLQDHAHLSRLGYFHWKLHIADFIYRKWNYIFGSSVRRKRTWHGTVSGTLSHYSPTFFQTGTEVLKEPGWWKLTYCSLSPFKTMQLKYDLSFNWGKKINVKGHSEEDLRNTFSTAGPGTLRPSTSGCYSSTEPDLDGLNGSDSDSLDVDIDVDLNIENPFSSDCLSQIESGLSGMFDLHATSEDNLPFTSNVKHYRNAMNTTSQDETCDTGTDTDSSIDETSCTVPSKSLFVSGLHRPLPWTLSSRPRKTSIKYFKCVPMTEYDELKILHRLSKFVEKNSLKVPKDIRRLYRKLVVRHEQRHRRLMSFSDSLPLFCNLHVDEMNTPNSIRTLDRYQVLGFTKGQADFKRNQHQFLIRLLGRVEPTCFLSPYTERLLKPFIRRDYNCRPQRLLLLSEIRDRANKNNPAWKEPRQYPVDFSYVQPQHIPIINSMCELFFWPGIDLSESLQYPDFSCVALYRKLVVGFAFMVPDVSHNESYISFLFTHPEWRRAGIATFMLYHVIQTCMGKDVTLHVSVTNPAIILYQKFGFKVEEIAQDFYDKYLPNDSKECKHALFLRLNR